MQDVIDSEAAGRVFDPVAAAEWLTREYGREVSADAVRRWARIGLKVADGRTVKLAAARVGGRLVIRQRDLSAFLAALRQPAAVPAYA